MEPGWYWSITQMCVSDSLQLPVNNLSGFRLRWIHSEKNTDQPGALEQRPDSAAAVRRCVTTHSEITTTTVEQMERNNEEGGGD